MKDRDKGKDLLTVATLILDHCKDQGWGWGLDEYRPLGIPGAVTTGILKLLAIKPGSADGYTGEQLDYAWDLYAAAREWIPARWRELTGQPPKGDE